MRHGLAVMMVSVLVWGGFSTPVTAQTLDEFYESPIPEERAFNVPGQRASYGGLTPGVGREDVYYAFSGCNRVGWIKQQRLTRTQWELAVDKMAQDCDMEPFEGSEKEILVNYLTRHYGRYGR